MKLILLSVAGKTLPGLITGDLSLSAMNLPRVPLAIMHSAPLFIRANSEGDKGKESNNSSHPEDLFSFKNFFHFILDCS